MKAKTSDKGRGLLRDVKASNALVHAIVANPRAFANGNAVSFKVPSNGQQAAETVSVRKVL